VAKAAGLDEDGQYATAVTIRAKSEVATDKTDKAALAAFHLSWYTVGVKKMKKWKGGTKNTKHKLLRMISYKTFCRVSHRVS